MAAKAKLTTTDREDIARRFGKGVCAAVLAEEFHVSENCIRVTAKKFMAGAGEPRLKPKPPAPEEDYPQIIHPEEAKVFNGCSTGRGPIMVGFPGANITPAFKTAVADMCRQAFEEKIKEALDGIFFKP